MGFQPVTNLVFVPNFRASYLGGGHDPFYLVDDPAEAKFQVPNLRLADGMTIDRLGNRRDLLAHFDRLQRANDRSGAMQALDQFDQAAYDMVTGAGPARPLTCRAKTTRRENATGCTAGDKVACWRGAWSRRA